MRVWRLMCSDGFGFVFGFGGGQTMGKKVKNVSSNRFGENE